MSERTGEIIVGILGAWASGKSTASRALVHHLGGAGNVVFINDQELIAREVVDHLFAQAGTQVTAQVQEDGTQRLASERATVWLRPGEELATANLATLRWTCTDEALCEWIDAAREKLGRQIGARCVEGKPIVVEAGFGTCTQPVREAPFSHTMGDLFARLGEAGLDPQRIRWIVVEASYATRSARNASRPVQVPARLFDRYAADGGDLEPDQERRWAARGLRLRRVPNDHGDVERFRADVVAAFDALYAGVP